MEAGSKITFDPAPFLFRNEQHNSICAKAQYRNMPFTPHLYINLNNTYLYYAFVFLGKNLFKSNTPKTADTNEPQRMPSFACPKIPAPPSNEA